MKLRYWKNYLIKIYDLVWEKVHPSARLHSADIMMPHRSGPTAYQLIVVSRLLDTEAVLKGDVPLFHTLFSDGSETTAWNKAYKDFVTELESNGFDHSTFRPVLSTLGICGLADCTHRMGYLLSRTPNFFVDVRLRSPFHEFELQEEGIDFYSSRGASERVIQELNDRYKMLIGTMRCHISAILSAESMHRCEEAIGDMDGISGMEECSDIDYGDIPNIYRRHLPTGRSSYKLVHLHLCWQEMYFKNGRIRSRVVDELYDSIDRSDECYFCSTVAESVELDNLIKPVYANI